MLEDLGDRIRHNDKEDNYHIELLKEGIAADSGNHERPIEHESPLEDTILNGRYRVTETRQSNQQAGRRVRMAEDIQTGATVFLKEYGLPRVKDLEYSEVEKQYRSESEISKMLSEIEGMVVPHVLDTFEDGYFRYIVFEKKEGRSIRQVVEGGRFYSERDVAGIALQALDQLKYPHSKDIINRDIKPDHLLVDDNYQLTGLLDFSAAGDRVYTTNTLTRGVFSGFYSAPEVIMGKKPDNRSDYYSIGAVMFYLLTKKVPDTCNWIYQPSQRFVKKELKSAGVSSQLSKMVVRLLSENPDRRYQDFEDFRNELVKVYGKEKFIAKRTPEIAKAEQTLEDKVDNEQVIADGGAATRSGTGEFCGWEYLLQQDFRYRFLGHNHEGGNALSGAIKLAYLLAMPSAMLIYAVTKPGSGIEQEGIRTFGSVMAGIALLVNGITLWNISMRNEQIAQDYEWGYEDSKRIVLEQYEKRDWTEVFEYLERNEKQRGPLYLELINHAMRKNRKTDAMWLLDNMQDCSRKEKRAGERLIKELEQSITLDDAVSGDIKLKGAVLKRYNERYDEEHWKMQYLTYDKKAKRTNFLSKFDAVRFVSTTAAAALLISILNMDDPKPLHYFCGIVPIAINGAGVIIRGYELVHQCMSSRHLPHNYAANKNRKDLAEGLRKAYAVSPRRALRYAAGCESSARIQEGVESTFMMYDDIQKMYLEILTKAMQENEWQTAEGALDGIAGLEGKASVNPKVIISRLLENFDHRGLPSGFVEKASLIGMAKDGVPDWVPVEFAKKVHAITKGNDNLRKILGGQS